MLERRYLLQPLHERSLLSVLHAAHLIGGITPVVSYAAPPSAPWIGGSHYRHTDAVLATADIQAALPAA